MNKDWLDIDVLEDYLDGKLDAKTMNRVEREALEDPFVAEALAGLSESPKRSLQSLSLLQKQLHERIAEHQSVKKTSVITWQRLSIATTAAVMFVAVSIMFWMRENNHQKELAGRSKKVDVTIATKDGRETPASVQAAPVLAAESADKQTEKEIDKAIKSTKANSYAARVKPKAKGAMSAADAAQPLSEVVVSAAPVYNRQAMKSVSMAKVASLQNTLNGKVVDQSGQALPGVSVQVVGTNLSAVTDADGMFKIDADTLTKEGTIMVNYIGFKSTELLAKVNQPVAVALVPMDLALNEVVVSAFGKAKKEGDIDNPKLVGAVSGQVPGIKIRGTSSVPNKAVMVSNPVGGWDKLFAYIKANNAFEKEANTGQTVELSFKIDKEGKPTAIKIVKEADAKYEKEAIRLLLNGPRWEKPVKASSRMTFKIDF